MHQDYKLAIKFYVVLLLICLASNFTTYSQALSGTYSIGPSGSSYSSFTNAVSDLVTNGVNGPVVFKISAGNYNETITIPAISGASTTNTITFSGAGSSSSGTRIYYSLSNNGSAVIYLNGASNIILDHVMVENTSTATTSFITYPSCIYMRGDSNNTVSNCSIKTATSTTTFYNVVAMFLSNSKAGTIINSHISGGLFGIYNYATSKNINNSYGNLLIKNSRFVGAYYNHIYGLADSFGLRNDVYDGNSFDSSASPYISALQLTNENGATIKNNITNGNVYSYLPIEIDYPNVGFSNQPFMIYNNMIGNFQYQGIYINGVDITNMNTYIIHNTIDEENNSPTYNIYADFSGCGGITIEDNILSANTAAVPLFINVPKATNGISVDGNNYYNTGGAALVTYNNTSFTKLASFQSTVSSLGWSLYDNNLKPHFVSKKNLHLDQTYVNPSGVYAGLDIDIDGDARCKLFPTAGADESTFGTGPSKVKFFLPTKIYPNSPTYVYNIAKLGEAKRHSWFVNGVHVSDSIVLLTNKFNVGSNTLKLVTTTCFGKDSFSQTFSVSAPTSVPATDYISDKNLIQAGDIVSFQDLSTGGPTKWQWAITPDSILKNGIKVPAIKYVYGSATFQSPQVQFLFPGDYNVCLTASNSIGKGGTDCKKKYVSVLPSYNMGKAAIVHDAFGFLYDNGGRNGDYSKDNRVESILIDPCADSVYLVITAFDLYCGYDYLRLFEGRNRAGKNLAGICAGNGSFTGTGNGFTGGKAYPGGCYYQCMPNVVKPDTIKAKNSIYVEMYCAVAYQSAGFAAHWWSKPRVSYKAKASFTASSDTVCSYQSITFTNTTKIDPNDPPTYLWDLDGDLNSFECIGTCATATYPYYVPGPITVTLIATNCGGSDTATHAIYVYNPAKPKIRIVVDNTTPTTSETVFLSAPIAQCIDKYKWTIQASGSGTGKASFINGTSFTDAAPQISFSDTGYYDLSLYVENLGGYQKDSVYLKKYIHVRLPYCIPTVGTLNSDIGIFNVIFNTINKTSTQGAQAYTNYANNPSYSTTVARELTYGLAISRTSPATNAINRTVYIDWNADGSFTGKGEIVATDSNSLSLTYSVKIKIPSYAKAGATIMRVAVNKAAYSNKPCGKNEYGEYQDFRIYITPYNILPVITLNGKQGLKDTLQVDQNNVFKEDGFSASSFLYGDLSKSVIRRSLKYGSINLADSFNSNTIGAIFLFSYDVTDSSGNAAVTQYRIVKIVKDKTPPNLLVAGNDTILIAVTTTPFVVNIPKVISSIDLVDGKRPVKIDSVYINTTLVGNYVITYTSSDASGNTIKVYRVYKIIDSIKPVLTLIGKSSDVLEVFKSYKDPGVLVTDNYYSSILLAPMVKIKSNLDSAHPGTYHLVYTVTDPSGNTSIPLSRIIKVIDTLKPVLKLLGPNPDSVAVFNSYSDPGLLVSDNYDKAATIGIVKTGIFLTAFPSGKIPDKTGTYSIIYTAKDSSGNVNTITRIVKVQDRTAPTISLIGPFQVSICRWFNYTDAGYNLSDNYDSNKNIRVDTFGSFFTNGRTTIPNYLYIKYRATDKSGNVAISDPRIILVKPADDKSCISAIDNRASTKSFISVYPNPTTGLLNIKSSIPIHSSIRVSIMNNLGSEICVITDGFIAEHFNKQIDLGHLPAGLYYIRIVSEESILLKPIEIAR